MPTTRQLLFLVASTLFLNANLAFAQPLIDDRFDDDDITTNTTGNGSGWNPSFAGSTTEELNDVFTINMTSGANSRALLSKETFSANQSDAIYGTFTFSEMLRPLNSSIGNGVAGWYAGFVDNTEPDVMDDGFDAFSLPINDDPTSGAHRGGLWIAFKQREDNVDAVTGPLQGNEGHLIYTLQDQSTVLLEQWTWDDSVFEFQDTLAIPTGRSDRVGQDLIADDIAAEISSDSTGYSIRFFSSDDSAIVPPDMSGTWAEKGITDLSSLDTVRAVGFAGQNGGNAQSAVTIELDRVYVANHAQRDADASGLVYTWGSRPNDDGNWGDTDGWQVGGVNTVTIPNVVLNSRSADAVEVQSGTVDVANADQGAWSVQVNNGATLEVSAGRTLTVIDNEFGDATDILTGGELVLGGTLVTPDINVAGTLNFADGTLRLGNGTISTLTTSSDGTIANDGEVTVGQATLGAGDTLNKQRTGTLILDQSGGANSFAATSTISIQQGSVAAVNDATNNALSGAGVSMDGGTLVLTAGVAGATTHDSPVAVNTSGTILAGQVSGSLANESVTLGGSNGVTINGGEVATLQTADGYLMNVAGAVSGAGTLRVGDGADVNLSGNIAPAVLEFQGNTSNATVGVSAVPTTAYQFSPTVSTPDMVIDFPLTSAAGAIIDENDDVFTGTVQLNNSSNDYTGTTRIVSGTLLPKASGGSPSGDYDGNGTVEPADYDEWKSAFGDSVSPGSGADGNSDGIVNLVDYTVWRDNLGATASGGSGLPAASLLQFEGSSLNNVAVLQSSEDFTRNIGTGAGEVNWVGSGGFAADGGGTVSVTLEGGSQLTWDSATAGFNSQSLKLGSPSANGAIVVTNDIDLNNDVRTLELRDNQGSTSDVSELSGVISSSAGGADVLRVTGQTRQFESGHLRLTNASNSYTTLEISLGTVEAEDGVGLPPTANLRFTPEADRDDPMIFATSGTFDRNIGAAAGEVLWAADGAGGFAAIGGPLTVTLEGGATLTPSDPDTGFNGGQIQLGSPVADGIVTFTNNTDEAGGTTFFETFDNPNTDSDGIIISGNHTSLNTFRIDGDGPVELSGTVSTNNTVYVNNGGAGALSLNISGNMTVDNNFTAEVFNEVNVFVNGTLSVDNQAQARNSSAIGGTGTIFMTDTDGNGDGNQRFQIQNGGFLRPGADLDSVGTLTLDMTLAGTDTTPGLARFQNGSRFELEFEEDGGSVTNDVLNVTASAGFPDLLLGEADEQEWFVELDALNDLTSLVSSSDEFDFITFNGNIDVAVNGVVFNTAGAGTGVIDNAILESSDFDVSLATVEYEVFSDFSGRIFVTGLGLPSGALQAASVPEPATAVLAMLLIAAGALRARSAVR